MVTSLPFHQDGPRGRRDRRALLAARKLRRWGPAARLPTQRRRAESPTRSAPGRFR